MYNYFESLLTPEDVAEILNIGMNSCYKLLNSGKIKAMRIGRIWKIPKRSVQGFISSETRLGSGGCDKMKFCPAP